MEDENKITSGVTAKEIILAAASALSNQWCEKDIEKLKFLAAQIESDFGAHDDFNNIGDIWRESFIKQSERIEELIKERDMISNAHAFFISLQKTHYCPECKTVWRCFDAGCKTNYEMLCVEHDTREVRERLGGKWAKWVEVKIPQGLGGENGKS